MQVEVPKLGNCPLQGAEHGVALSEDAPQHGLRILPPEPPGVVYKIVPDIPNPKTAPLRAIFKFVCLT
jgi:hypothetical protein